MPVSSSTAAPTANTPGQSGAGERIAWIQVTLAAVLMVATLPGRTQGLGLLTEPLLRDLQLDRVVYAGINLWATLLGSAFCLPAGWLLDRFGLRWTSTALVLLLGAVVWAMSGQAGTVAVLFLLVLLTRALGQSALSVASITAVGKNTGRRVGMAMGVYSVLLSVLFAAAFVVVGGVVSSRGWRAAWAGVALALILGVAPLVALFLRNSPKPADAASVNTGGLSLLEALRTPAFWIFGGAIALFGLVSSGLGLFNEAVLAERGFDQKTYHAFLAVTTLVALIGQFLCGWCSQRWPMQRLLGAAMFLYAAGLGALPWLHTLPQLWTFAAIFGISGGMITVIFFAVWSHVFGHAQLGRIQGAAQMLTVFASAAGPLCFAKCHERFDSYSPLLLTLAPLVLIIGLVAWRMRLRPFIAEPA
ncbi:MAG: transporter [Chthoniobacteraceae bacterium]|nr:transporter [Chthoniobacteraceae bacterium]